MHPLTQPIRVIFNPREPGYRTKTYLAYAMLFVLMAGDAVRYTIGWGGWIGILAALFIAALGLIIKNEPKRIFALAPILLWVLLGWMLLSSIWSFYQALTVGASFVQLATTIAGLFFAGLFSWRHLLKIFADVVRFILASSLLFELYAALVVRGPIEPIFKNYTGDTPPASAFLWTQGHLFDGQRIQGIVGNSNLLAYVAMIGVIVFAVEYAIIGAPRLTSVVSLSLAVGALALARSSGIDFAMAAVAVSAVVSIAAEGKPRDVRHRYYRIAWSAAGVAAAAILLFRREIFDLLGKSPDMTGRTGIWKLVLSLIDDRPWLGWGWTSHWVPGVKPYEGLVVINNVPYYQAHNAFLDVWLQLGIFGLLIFALLILTTFIPLWRLAVRHTSSLYLWPILLFIGLLVQALVESRMLIEVGWVMLVIFASKATESDEVLEPRGRSPKRARVIASLKNLLRFRARN